MNRLRIFKRLKIIEWKQEMLLLKIASVADPLDRTTRRKIEAHLTKMPKELDNE